MSAHEPWGDERLTAAWRDRAATVSTPTDLTDRTMAQLRVVRNRRSTPSWRLILPVAAAVAIAVVLVRPLTLATPAGPTPPPVVTATSGPTPLAAPTTPFPVVTVADLIERSTNDASAEQVMVRGWIAGSAPIYRCYPNPNPHPLVPWCGSGLVFLMDDPVSVTVPNEPPAGAIEAILPSDAHIEVPIPIGRTVEVIAVGHQRDHRWTTCPEPQKTACLGRFVIDRLLPADASADAPLAPWMMAEGDPEPKLKLGPDEVAAKVEGVVGPARVVSIGVVGPGSLIWDIEPITDLRRLGEDALVVVPPDVPSWIVRAITADSAGVLRTFRVSDADPTEGTSGVSEITETAIVALDDVLRTFVVDLGPWDGIAPESSRVTVVDRSGRLVTALKPEDAMLERIRAASDGRQVWLVRDASIAGRAYLAWTGGMCELPAITIDAAASRVEIGHGTAANAGCRLAAISRIVQLDFDDPAVIDRLESSIQALAPTPAPTGLGDPFSATIDLISLTGPTLALKFADDSGSLIEARSASRRELDFFNDPIAPGSVRLENLLPFAESTIIVLWDTTCDYDLTMNLSSREAVGGAAGARPSVPTDLELGSRQTLCDGITVRLGVVLRYAVEVIAGNIRASRSYMAPTETVFGLPVMTVEEAIAIRDAGIDDRVIVVRGWFPPQSAAICVMNEPASPLELGCYDNGRLLAAGPEWPTRDDDPRFFVDVDEVERAWMPHVRFSGESVDVVLVGHFDDPRSRECPVEAKAACRDRFVVDRVESVDGRAVESAIAKTAGVELPPADPVIDKIRNIDPGAIVLSMVYFDHDTLIPDLPNATESGEDPSILIPSSLWRVKVLDGDRSVRYVVWGAGESYVYRVTDTGYRVRVDDGAIAPTLAPWPPDGATIVTLTSPIGAGRPPVMVAVVDQTGFLKSVGDVADDQIPFEIVPSGGGRWVAGDPRDARRNYLAWTGGPCASRLTVTVESLDSILIDGGPQPGCDAMGIVRSLILTFKDPVDPSIFDLGYKETRIEE